MLFACQCHGDKPRRIGLGGKFLLLPTRGWRTSRFRRGGDGMNDGLEGKVSR
ncbi:hypothetical protein AK973_4019 [Pseudomonas brassicacearum]|nr:hypothetical protein AK973_4019 [Pseudomonas brassicacearum]